MNNSRKFLNSNIDYNRFLICMKTAKNGAMKVPPFYSGGY